VQPQPHRSRLVALAVAGGALAVALVAVPVLGQGSSTARLAGAAPAASDHAAASEKPGKGPKADKDTAEGSPVSLTGTVGTRTDADGDTAYTLTVGTTVYDLEAGPPWFWGDNHPLKGLVGKNVKIDGEQAAGSSSVEVFTADGKALREPGKPPWAGGWKVVGKTHPGWSQAKADRQAAKGEHGTGRPSWAGPKTPEGSDDPND
jgi:hypothetical protein